MIYKIGDVLTVSVEGQKGHDHGIMTGTIYEMEPCFLIRDANGNRLMVKPKDDVIKLLTDGEAMLWRLENA